MTARLISATAALSVARLDALVQNVAPKPDPERSWLVTNRQQRRVLAKLMRRGKPYNPNQTKPKGGQDK